MATASREIDPRKLWRRMMRLARKNGDQCQGCRRAFQILDVSIVGYDAARHLLMVGECCAERLLSVVAVSLYFAANSNQPWSEDDRAWFAAHPERAHRLRRAYPKEWPGMAGMCYTVVCQQAPGRRDRLGVVASAELLPAAGEVPEARAWAIFDLAGECHKRGDRGVTAEEIAARSAMLENETRA
jgi:hypothetical protein